MALRVQRFIAQAGLASRRQAEEWIRQGRVRVNGNVVALGTVVEPGCDRVTVDGQEVTLTSVRWVLALHKPKGYTTSLKDRHATHLITELIPAKFGRLFPVGRLDRDTSGLILLTNDGDLAYRLSHPSFAVPKVYEAWVQGIPRSAHLQRLQAGIMLEDGPATAQDISLVATQEGRALIRLTLTEGRKREVRRIFRAVGHPVVELKRVSYAGIPLGDLPEGAFRPLTRRELRELDGRPGDPVRERSGGAPKIRSPRNNNGEEDSYHGPSRASTRQRGGQRPGSSTVSPRRSRPAFGDSRGNSGRPDR